MHKHEYTIYTWLACIHAYIYIYYFIPYAWVRPYAILQGTKYLALEFLSAILDPNAIEHSHHLSGHLYVEYIYNLHERAWFICNDLRSVNLIRAAQQTQQFNFTNYQ